ncbi:MAG: Crp/Fnr family transcriptional regulator [Paracoccaceae bacterium]|nr:Crp/Fnr family transcriptional regulator [Paracoccaceae bacterium]MDP5349832.1 Crp/Fnr family transcriptional regulator [Paracoccaceae bacterium]MDP5364703.1 Crp/Fnr family transcriptional regulator [Paracoccaceae bacterium]
MSWLDEAPALDGLEPRDLARLARLHPMDLPAGAVIFRPGDAAQGYAVVLSGQVDVSLTGASGREMLLYSVAPGQSCVQTTFGLLSDAEYSAEAETVRDTRLVVIPRALFLDLLDTSAAFRSLVFAAFADRMAGMLKLVETVAFTRAECRLAARLLALSETGPVHATHSELAAQAGTAREVVSRRLDAWARKGWVRTARGQVEVIDRAALSDLAHADM